MARNNENTPLPSQTRVNGSVFGVSKATPSSDFFTDSILEDTSKIPSPSPKKHHLSKPRRAVAATRPLQVARGSANATYRSSSPQSGSKHHVSKHQPPAPLLPRPSHRSSQSDLITPPQSRDGPDIKSPTSDVSSPPRGLTDVYQRIHDEEELAERDGEEDEEEDDTIFDEDEEPPNMPRKSSSQRSLASKDTTPVPALSDANKENVLDEQTGNLTEASGLSFLQSLTDSKIAAKLTPHFTDRAKDLRRLQNVSSRPIVFNQGPKPSEIADDGRSSASSDRGSSSGRLPRARTAPADRIDGMTRNRSDIPHELAPPPVETRGFDEDEDTPDELLDAEKEVENRRLRRFLSRSRRFSQPVTSAPGPRLEIDTASLDEKLPKDDDDTRRSAQSEPSVLIPQQSNSMPSRNPVPATTKGLLSMWSRKAAGQRGQKQNDSSQIDWADVGADVPLPSVEDSSTPQASPANHQGPEAVRSPRSIERLRRLDNDFTGMSFQVSESPPVRSRKSVGDYVLGKEIETLERKALTTNRLDAIREKDPRAAHRKLSRTPSAGRLESKQSAESLVSQGPESAGQQVPDTPVVIYRSSSSSSSQKSKHDRKASHDHLQRLARAMSTTPKGSPAAAPVKEKKIDNDDLEREGDATQDSYASSANAPELLPTTTKKPAISATPKVIGAWTDTVLPDTVKTVRQTNRQPSRYAQTPHVNAGGWIDTPAPKGIRQSSALAPMTIEEVTEDITADVPTQNLPELDKVEVMSPVEVGATSPPHANQQILPPSLLSQVLDENTFGMGDETRDSVADLLDETTTILDNRRTLLQNQSTQELLATDELGFLDRIGGKIQEVAVSIHDTRKGISHLEKVFMRASSPSISTNAESSPSTQQKGIIPVIYSTITFPVPLLFHVSPNKTSSTRARAFWPFGRPTPLGFLVLAIWTWYILEILASEVFAHPLHAQQYIWPPTHTPEPRFPYVLPTVFLRSLGLNVNFSHLSSPTSPFGTQTATSPWFWTALYALTNSIYLFFRAIYRVLGMFLGWTDGFVDSFPAASPSSASQHNAARALGDATGNLVQGVKTAVSSAAAFAAGARDHDEQWNMMNDDFI